MRRFLGVLLPLLGLLAASACDGGGAASVTFADYCDRWTTIVCDFAARCDCLHGGTPELCRTLMRGQCANDVEAPVNAGRQAFVEHEGGRCVAGLQSMLASCTPDLDDYPTSCDAVLVGLGPAGHACGADADCVPGLECWHNLCTATPGVGDACLGGSSCPSDLFCAAGGTCAALRGSGDPCPEGGAACANGLYCDHVTTTCAPLMRQGDPCMSEGGTCADGLYCSIASTDCEPYPGAGADCIDSSGRCADGLYCLSVGHTCTPLLADGASCTDDLECTSNDCTGGLCVASDSDRCPF